MTFSRVLVIISACVWSVILSARVDFLFAFIIYLPFRIFILYPLNLFKYRTGGVTSPFAVLSSFKLYYRSMLALMIKTILISTVFSPILLLLITAVYRELFPLLLGAALTLIFVFALIYQRTFAVPVLISQGESVGRAYALSFSMTRGKIGEITLFYLKRSELCILKLIPILWDVFSPFYYRSKFKFISRLYPQPSKQDSGIKDAKVLLS